MADMGSTFPAFNPSDSGIFYVGKGKGSVNFQAAHAPDRNSIRRELLKDLNLPEKMLGRSLNEMIRQITRPEVLAVVHIVVNGIDLLAISDSFHQRALDTARQQLSAMGIQEEPEQRGGCAVVIRPYDNQLILVTEKSGDLGPCNMELVIRLLQEICDTDGMRMIQAANWSEAKSLVDRSE